MEVSMQQTADLAITTKPFSIQAKVRVTPAGLLSIAALRARSCCPLRSLPGSPSKDRPRQEGFDKLSRNGRVCALMDPGLSPG